MSDQSCPTAAPDVRVWDPLLRLTHWSFALIIPAMWLTAENSAWAWHRRLGLMLLGILVFRVLWGFIGPETARFGNFVTGPRAVMAYVRGDLKDAAMRIGHSPLGGWSTLALLTVMMLQVSMGLFAGDIYDGMTGPLNPLVGVMTADFITDLHETFFYVVVGLIGVHLCAILFYGLVKREDLVSPMLNGDRPPMEGVSSIGPMPWGRGLAAIVMATGLAWWIGMGAPPFI